MSNVYAVRFAHSILEKYWDRTLPVDLLDIAEKLGVQVLPGNFSKGIFGSDDEISGTFQYVNGVPTCTINESHHINRQESGNLTLVVFSFGNLYQNGSSLVFVELFVVY